MNIIFKKESYIYFLIIFVLLIGIFTFRDFGIGIEEHFQRKSGLYWLNYLLNFFDLSHYKLITQEKLNKIETFTPNLFSIEQVPFYGVLFDLPLAFIEVALNINEPHIYFQIRHFIIFLIFIISAYFFYKLILMRYENTYLAIFGFVAFIITPRIYGNIFFDNKDVFFLSIFTINFYFLFKFYLFKSYKNLALLSLFCALSTSSRIIGIFIPITFVFIVLLSLFNKDEFKKNVQHLFIFIFLYFFFLLIHWPYLWTLEASQVFNFFEPFFYAMNPIVFFNGEFYQSKYLPLSYLPVWMLISSPIYLIILSSVGFIYQSKRLFNRLININEKKEIFKYDLWKTDKEKFDLFTYINLILVIILYISINLALLSGWRHFYFLNFFIVYYSCFTIYFSFKFIKIDTFKKMFSYILALFIIINLYDLVRYHPYQSVFFNKLVSNERRLKFEIDTQSLSRAEFLNEISKIKKNKIKIGTASWTPLEDARFLLPERKWKKFQFVGTNLKEADFIYTNYYYEININLNDKYEIPENFSLYKNLIIDGTRVYSIYKKNNL